jgi:hypothetical protein
MQQAVDENQALYKTTNANPVSNGEFRYVKDGRALASPTETIPYPDDVPAKDGEGYNTYTPADYIQYLLPLSGKLCSQEFHDNMPFVQ